MLDELHDGICKWKLVKCNVSYRNIVVCL